MSTSSGHTARLRGSGASERGAGHRKFRSMWLARRCRGSWAGLGPWPAGDDGPAFMIAACADGDGLPHHIDERWRGAGRRLRTGTTKPGRVHERGVPGIRHAASPRHRAPGTGHRYFFFGRVGWLCCLVFRQDDRGAGMWGLAGLDAAYSGMGPRERGAGGRVRRLASLTGLPARAWRVARVRRSGRSDAPLRPVPVSSRTASAVPSHVPGPRRGCGPPGAGSSRYRPRYRRRSAALPRRRRAPSR